MNTWRLWKSIYLMVGTAIGAGILAIPVSTSHSGFIGASLSLVICWLFMTTAAYYMLEVRLWFKKEEDLSTMTQKILGRSGQIITRVFYLLLLFALISVYIIVGSAWISEVLQNIFTLALNDHIIRIVFTVCVALLVYSGISNVSRVNQVITLCVLATLGVIIFLSMPHIEKQHLLSYNGHHIPSTLPLLITAFGFSIVIPSITPYLKHNKRTLRQALKYSSILIVGAYILWIVIAFGVIGSGNDGLMRFALSQDKGTEVINGLQYIINSSILTQVSNLFIITAILSSLFGVGQALHHYLKDSFRTKNKKLGEGTSIVISFGVPLLIVTFYPSSISHILGIAGIFVAVILGIIPTLMHMIGKKTHSQDHKTPLLNSSLLTWTVLIFFVLVIMIEIWNIS